MRKTKEKILAAALDLFNTHGFFQVTIRMIAQKAGMSSGNLNYHYQKREDILEALYFKMVEPFDQRIEQLPDTRISLSLIQRGICSSMDRMVAYKFFWTDLYNLLKINNEINERFIKVRIKRKEGYLMLFKKMQQQALMVKATFPAEYDLLAEKMLAYSNTWVYNAQLYQESNLLETTLREANILMSFLYPYLTAKGQQQFRDLAPELFL
jgi:AcrR family transcriptional regulator